MVVVVVVMVRKVNLTVENTPMTSKSSVDTYLLGQDMLIVEISEIWLSLPKLTAEKDMSG